MAQSGVLRSSILTPQLAGHWPDGQPFAVDIDRDNFLVGRHPEADLVVPSSAPFVSGRHFEIQRMPQGYALVDLNSTNGTRLDNELIAPMTAMLLKNGSIIRIGSEAFGSSLGFTFTDPNAPAPAVTGFETHVGMTSLLRVERVHIGRDPSNDIVLDAPVVARQHAVLTRYDTDHHHLKATEGNQIQVNGKAVEQAILKEGDFVQIGPFLFTYDCQSLQRYESRGYRVDVVDLFKEVKTKNGPLRILDQISMTVLPREFVALVGGSGAGKSTLLDALNGFRPAQGQVLINGLDLNEHYDAFRTQIGYVPQHEILPVTLTVDAALHYAARLRLAADLSAEERDTRITQALETVDMNTERIRSTRINRLSGGQRKRVSIAAELLADPKLFFLDEPASGLDPGREKKLMYTLRKMADEGRTIILITHATDNIVQVDQVAFLSQGKLVYFGPPGGANPYFEVNEFADIYEKIERNGDQWRQTFVQGKGGAYQDYVAGRQATRGQTPEAEDEKHGAGAALRQSLRQFIVYSQRMFRLVLTDPITLFVSLFVMPFVGVQQILVTERYELVGDPAVLADPARAALSMTENYLPALHAHTLIFGMAILAFLVGAFGGSQELIKERPIYLRERMVNLKLLPYLGSKFFVFAMFGLVQVALTLLLISIDLKLPADGQVMPGVIEMGITLFLTLMAGIATGLFISSISSNTTFAMYLVLIVVFFQYLFGGAIHDLRDKPVELISYAAATRWSSLAMGTTVDVMELAESTIVCGNKFTLDPASIRIDPSTGGIDASALQLQETDDPICTNRAMAPEEIFLPYGNSAGDLWRYWGILGGMIVLFALLTLLMVKRLDHR